MNRAALVTGTLFISQVAALRAFASADSQHVWILGRELEWACWFQLAFGMTAFESGLLVLALFAGNLGMKTVTTPILRRFGFRSVLVANGLISALLIFSFSLIARDTPKFVIVALLFAHGLSRSMQFTSINTLAFVDIPKSAMSSASSFFAVAQQMSLGMGVAVGADSLPNHSFGSD